VPHASPYNPLSGYVAEAVGYEVDFLGENEDTTKDAVLAAMMDRALARLNEHEHRIIHYYVFERLSYREIAEQLGWETGGLPDKKKAWREVKKALASLREKLTCR
jgi:DNA-directed RNA polymerase specialized sigma24 family protein